MPPWELDFGSETEETQKPSDVEEFTNGVYWSGP
jgi:hypothetical protein